MSTSTLTTLICDRCGRMLERRHSVGGGQTEVKENWSRVIDSFGQPVADLCTKCLSDFLEQVQP